MQRVLRRLALVWGCKESTAQDRLNNGHSCYQAVADANEALLAEGLNEDVATRMAVVDASLMGERIPSAADALYAHKLADAAEEAPQADFERNPCAETWERWRPLLAKDAQRIYETIKSHDAKYRGGR